MERTMCLGAGRCVSRAKSWLATSHAGGSLPLSSPTTARLATAPAGSSPSSFSDAPHPTHHHSFVFPTSLLCCLLLPPFLAGSRACWLNQADPFLHP